MGFRLDARPRTALTDAAPGRQQRMLSQSVSACEGSPPPNTGCA